MQLSKFILTYPAFCGIIRTYVGTASVLHFVFALWRGARPPANGFATASAPIYTNLSAETCELQIFSIFRKISLDFFGFLWYNRRASSPAT